jgi:carbohydrate-selective porin OprB
VSGATGATDATDSDSWFVGLQWNDAFVAGNAAGIAVGQAPSAETAGVSDATMLEFFYKFQVTDNISITPALFYVDSNQRYQDSNKWGGVIQTKFTF